MAARQAFEPMAMFPHYLPHLLTYTVSENSRTKMEKGPPTTTDLVVWPQRESDYWKNLELISL